MNPEGRRHECRAFGRSKSKELAPTIAYPMQCWSLPLRQSRSAFPILDRTLPGISYTGIPGGQCSWCLAHGAHKVMGWSFTQQHPKQSTTTCPVTAAEGACTVVVTLPSMNGMNAPYPSQPPGWQQQRAHPLASQLCSIRYVSCCSSALSGASPRLQPGSDAQQ